MPIVAAIGAKLAIMTIGAEVDWQAACRNGVDAVARLAIFRSKARAAWIVEIARRCRRVLGQLAVGVNALTHAAVGCGS